MKEKIFTTNDIHHLRNLNTDNHYWFLKTHKGLINIESIISIEDIMNDNKYMRDISNWEKVEPTPEQIETVDFYLKSILTDKYTSLVYQSYTNLNKKKIITKR